MSRFMLAAGLLMLAACSDDKAPREPEDTVAITPPTKAAPAPSPDAPREDMVEEDQPDPVAAAPAKPEAGNGGDKAIPVAIRGRWALKAADCQAKRGTDLTALTIDATNLRFYESHGELARVRKSDTNSIVADYKFSGEGIEWDRRMQLELADGGKTLVRREQGEGAAARPMRYTRCA